MTTPKHFLILLLSLICMPGMAQKFELMDIFELEYVSDPQISPDGFQVVYSRNYMDVMTDRAKSDLWIIQSDGSKARPLVSNARSPRWSADGSLLFYLSSKDGKTQIYKRWMKEGQNVKLTHLTNSPGNISLSPDGKWMSFSMFVPKADQAFISLPPKPKGATWAPPAKYIDKVTYRSDGAGYLPNGYTHIFLLGTDGGTARQLTQGDFHHRGAVAWAADSKSILFAANRHPEGEFDPQNSEIYELSIADASIKALTSRQGPDNNPTISPDGKQIAYLGYDDQLLGYQISKLYVMSRDGSKSRWISKGFDRAIGNIHWAADGKGLYFQYDDKGNSKVAYIDLKGKVEKLADNLGGNSLGRPYGAGSYSVAKDGTYAYTHSRPDHPADLAVGKGKEVKRLTYLNEDLFSFKKLAEVEEIWYTSSFDGRDIQGWIVKPQDFDPKKKYPLLLEIHGGPFANYGDRFTAEIQLYASAGYVVLYTNPRGSSSYGAEFGNLIHHNYPGEDYDDLMSGVDTLIAKGYIDENQLYVTGGSGGGVLSSWIIGKTNRFRAAVVAKPVINWYSFVLTADGGPFFYKYWFPGFPWDHQEHYMKRSPLSLVGNVSTPTMLLTGEADHRTPISETEQYYQALKLRKVEAAMVRIPEASHGIAARPSNLMSKVAHILGWFEKYR